MLEIQQHIALKPYNTLALAATARYFVLITEPEQIPEAMSFAKQHQLAVLVLAGGSNMVLPEHFAGLVLYMACRGFTVVEPTDNLEGEVLLTAAAGENWQQLVDYSLQHDYYGLENLSLIPGSVGAAPIQNIGAYGVELNDVLESVYGWHIEQGCWQSLSRAECQFGYRDSVFKRALKGRFIISSVTLQLNRRGVVHTDYGALRDELAEQGIGAPTPGQVAELVTTIRQRKLPDPLQLANAGSFFKNPIVSSDQAASLRQQYPGLVCFTQPGGRVKLAAGWLLEEAGWKGRRQGNVGMHDQQSLVLINYGGASYQEVLSFADSIKEDIQHKFSVSLDIEPSVIG